jgi:hypothetical protein
MNCLNTTGGRLQTSSQHSGANKCEHVPWTQWPQITVMTITPSCCVKAEHVCSGDIKAMIICLDCTRACEACTCWQAVAAGALLDRRHALP